MKINKKYIQKFLAILFLAIFVGGILEGVFAGIHFAKAKENKGQYEIGIENVQTKNMKKKAEAYSLEMGKSKITWELSGEYVNKFEYYYDTNAFVDAYADVYTYDIYGNACKKRIADSMIVGMYRSVLNIDGKVDKIVLHYNNTEANATISGAAVDNNFKYNPYIALFISTICFVGLFLLCFKDVYVKHIEWAFLVCAVTIGGFMVLISPAYTVGWDEEIHFLRAYEMGSSDENEQTAEYLFNTHVMYKLSASHQTIEERIDAIRCINNLTGMPSDMEKRYDFSANFVSLIPQMLIFDIGGKINIPFYILWVLGKAINLIIYSIVIFWAIKKVPVAKYLMSVVALVPTAIFQATHFTYDALLIACSLFGMAIILKGLLDKEEHLSKKEMVGFLIAMVIACLSKAVYAPLFFIALFIPKRAFVSEKESRSFRCMIVLLFLAAICTMILPTIIKPSSGGDPRGGATSASGQMDYIFGQPFAYAYILLSNIGKTLVSYLIGGQGLCIMGHYGVAKYKIEILMAVFLCFVTITDTFYKYDNNIKDGRSRVLTWKIKGILLIAILIIVAFIWTALYISFTEVGAINIAGVQGRYYLPILFATLILFQGNYLKNIMNESRYQAIVFGGISLISLFVILNVIVIPSCL